MDINDSDLKAGLKHFFGFGDFLDNQEEIIRQIISGQDLCVIMPTGAGKSLCYQLPILMSEGYGIIVSPLISLMKDQVDSLREKNVPAAFINSSISQLEQQNIMRETAIGNIKLLYIAPERFHMTAFTQLLEHQPPSMLVVDEAHCISQWGHDFRPSYLKIGEAIKAFSIPQVCAFTATATKRVREDISAQLHRTEMKVHVAGFKRPNLCFSVISSSSAEQKKEVLDKLLKKNVPTIIYASTRKAVDQLSENFSCISYHAGMSDENRSIAQDKFMNDSAPVLVATNAFGMGIDRPDVRRVIHYNMPGSLEAYYQEAGRAGRDGEAAECILLFSYADRYVQEFLIDLSNPDEAAIRGLYSVLLQLAKKENSNSLSQTLSSILPLIPAAKSENQLSSAMRILEKHGYIERGFRQQNTGTLQFTGNIQDMLLLSQLQETQRNRFIYRCLKHFGETAANPQECSYEMLSSIAGLNIDQIKRVLHALQGEKLQWTPPFAGRTTELLMPEKHELDIDFESLRTKKDFELDRLDEVIAYTQSNECRQKFLISYFGEDSEEWRCENCDNCGAAAHTSIRIPDASEMTVIKVMLRTVADLSGQFGSGRISQLLAGAKRPEIIDRGLDAHPSFGALQNMSQNNVLALLRSLEDADCIARTGNPEYPCIRISSFGESVLRGTKSIRLNFAGLKIKTNAREAISKFPKDKFHRSLFRTGITEDNTGNFEPIHAELFDALKKLRKEIADERGVPAFVILHDETLIDLAKKQPVTIAEASRIKGIGKIKAAALMPRFIEIIKAGIGKQ